MSVSGPLSSAAPLSILNKKIESAEYRGETSTSTFHIFINNTNRPADLFYFYDSSNPVEGGQGRSTTMVKHGSIEPGSNLYIGEAI